VISSQWSVVSKRQFTVDSKQLTVKDKDKSKENFSQWYREDTEDKDDAPFSKGVST